MVGLILKTFLVCFVLLTASCAIKEQIVQSQSISTVDANQNANAQNSSNANLVENKTVDYFAHFKSEHREVLREWLKSKTYLRPAVEEIDNGIFDEKNYTDKAKFKENFEGNLKFHRETLGEGNYQYYAVGDMNHDKKVDFAVLLVDTRKPKGDVDHFVLAIFNAPFKPKRQPSYYEENLYGITNSYIKFNAFDEPYLFLGKFESDVYCATYYPKGKTYYFKDCVE
ncbi:MAG: hypothetical protein M3209_12110 [Acidobacteriota bacterium]|nr:hypothetical protein [Acidobacteriota bacterium]